MSQRTASSLCCIVGGLMLLYAAWTTYAPDGIIAPTGNAAISHQAAINFCNLLGEEYDKAATMDASAAFDSIEDHQVVLRQTVLFEPIGKAMNEAAYPGGGEFDQRRFTKAMQELARGLKAVK